MVKTSYYLFLFLFFFSCGNDYTPKPIGYVRMEKKESKPIKYEDNNLSFLYSDIATIENVQADTKDEKWINISYPYYDVTIYCTYMPVSKNSLPKTLDDSYQLAYSHAAKASGIKQTQYIDTIHNISAVIYDIKGSVAAPVQFFATDSISSFFRGSLYYNHTVNIDSIAPVTEFLREDIITLIESIRWNYGKSKR